MQGRVRQQHFVAFAGRMQYKPFIHFSGSAAIMMDRTAHNPAQDWQKRLAFIVETMRDMSRQTDPQGMVRAYGSRMREIIPTDRMVSLSRRGLEPSKYRITRSSLWKEEVDPWK